MNINIKTDNAGRFHVEGELSFANVAVLENLGAKLIKAASREAVFDLKRVVILDNSGLALLTAWLRCAKKANKKIRFVHLAKQIQDMAKVCGLVDLI